MNTDCIIDLVNATPAWRDSILAKTREHAANLAIADTLTACGFGHLVEKAEAVLGEKETRVSPHITAPIAFEERLYAETLDRGRRILVQQDVRALTGADWARLHETYGLDPSVGEAILGEPLPESIFAEYEDRRKTQKEIGRRGQKKVVVVAKTSA